MDTSETAILLYFYAAPSPRNPIFRVARNPAKLRYGVGARAVPGHYDVYFIFFRSRSRLSSPFCLRGRYIYFPYNGANVKNFGEDSFFPEAKMK